MGDKKSKDRETIDRASSADAQYERYKKQQEVKARKEYDDMMLKKRYSYDPLLARAKKLRERQGPPYMRRPTETVEGRREALQSAVDAGDYAEYDRIDSDLGGGAGYTARPGQSNVGSASRIGMANADWEDANQGLADSNDRMAELSRELDAIIAERRGPRAATDYGLHGKQVSEREWAAEDANRRARLEGSPLYEGWQGKDRELTPEEMSSIDQYLMRQYLMRKNRGIK